MTARTLNNVFCANCSCALAPCRAAHSCNGWMHLGDGQHRCPPNKKLMTFALPRKD